MSKWNSMVVEAFDKQLTELRKVRERLENQESITYAVSEILDHPIIFVTGMGKAGHVGRKFSSTLSSLGIPAVFIHPGESQHGDLGMLTYGSLLIAFSNSGKTREVLEMVEQAKVVGMNMLISVTAKKDSLLGKASNIAVAYGEVEESCHLGMAPTTSTSAMQITADSIAVTASEIKKFTKEQYGRRHHGGYLGQKARS